MMATRHEETRRALAKAAQWVDQPWKDRGGHRLEPVFVSGFNSGVRESFEGWRDERGRKYDATFHLVCDSCTGHAGETLDADTMGSKVTTDKDGDTLCPGCRYERKGMFA